MATRLDAEHSWYESYANELRKSLKAEFSNPSLWARIDKVFNPWLADLDSRSVGKFRSRVESTQLGVGGSEPSHVRTPTRKIFSTPKNFKESIINTPYPRPTQPSLRERGLSPRQRGTNARALGTNPKARGTNPRALGLNARAIGANPKAFGVNPTAMGLNPKALGTNPNQLESTDPDWITVVRDQALLAVKVRKSQLSGKDLRAIEAQMRIRIAALRADGLSDDRIKDILLDVVKLSMQTERRLYDGIFNRRLVYVWGGKFSVLFSMLEHPSAKGDYEPTEGWEKRSLRRLEGEAVILGDDWLNES